MTPFSASDAAVEGFRVVRRRWRLVIGWGLFNLMAFMGACVLAGVLILVAVMAVGSEEQAGQVGAVIGALALGLTTLIIEVVIVAALFRSELTEDAPGFLHLRLGRDELRIAAVWLVMFAAVLAAVLAGLFAAAAAGKAGGGWAGVSVGVLAGAVVVWLVLRLSLAAPVAVAERRLGFAASWRMTRGRVGALLGMSALSFCLLAMIAILSWLAMALLSGAISGFSDFGPLSLSDPEAFARRPGFYITQLAVQFIFAPVLWVLSQAPLASAYRQLR